MYVLVVVEAAWLATGTALPASLFDLQRALALAGQPSDEAGVTPLERVFTRERQR